MKMYMFSPDLEFRLECVDEAGAAHAPHEVHLVWGSGGWSLGWRADFVLAGTID